MSRRQKSLLHVIVLSALVLVGWYWLVLPSHNANRFVAAIKAQDFATADGMFVHPSDRFLARWHDECAAFRADVDLAPWTVSQLPAGERHVLANVDYGRPGLMTSYELRFSAGQAGLQAAQVYSMGGGSMTLARY